MFVSVGLLVLSAVQIRIFQRGQCRRGRVRGCKRRFIMAVLARALNEPSRSFKVPGEGHYK